MSSSKTYPLSTSWLGQKMYVVLGNEAHGCQWSKCVYCPFKNAYPADGFEDNRRNIDDTLDYYKSHLASIDHVAVLIGGSALNEKEVSSETRNYLLHAVRSMPRLRLIEVETRPEYCIEDMLSDMRGRLDASQRLAVTVGYETRDPKIRELLGKGISDDAMKRLFDTLNKSSVDFAGNVMLKPWFGMCDGDAEIEAIETIRHLKSLCDQYGTRGSINLYPVWITSEMAGDAANHHYRVPQGSSVAKVILGAEGLLPIYVGLDDEGFAVKGLEYEKCWIDAINEFNLTQNTGALRKLLM